MIDWSQVRTALVGKAVNYLGGQAGTDYAKDAEDLAQDTLVILLEKEMASTEEAIKLGTEVMRLDAVDHKRVQTRRREIEQESGDLINRNCGANWSGDDPAEVVEAEQQLEAIETLTPALATALRQYTVEGLTYAEIAEAEGVTEGAIRERVSQAKKQLGE